MKLSYLHLVRATHVELDGVMYEMLAVSKTERCCGLMNVENVELKSYPTFDEEFTTIRYFETKEFV